MPSETELLAELELQNNEELDTRGNRKNYILEATGRIRHYRQQEELDIRDSRKNEQSGV